MNTRAPRAPYAFRPTHLVRRRLRELGFAKKHEWLAGNLGKELGSINHELLEPCDAPVTSAGGFELLGSYNWRRRSRNTQPEIFVPGEAPGLVPHKLPLVTGVAAQARCFRDVNAALLPAFPFEPMFRAVGVMRPGFRFDDVDLVANRSSLHHLLRLADGGRCKDAFRLDLAMVKNTLIVTPLWKRVTETVNFGRTFEQYFAQHRPGLAHSQSHHRAICYHLGPLKVAILCEVDAACPEIPPAWKSLQWQVGRSRTQTQTAPLGEDPGSQTSAEMALFSSINKRAFAYMSDPKTSSRVTHLGNGTPSAHTAELTTMKQFGKKDKIAQMWLGRTPYLVESLHHGNTFTDVKITHCGSHLLAFENTRQDALQKLVTAVKTLAHFTARARGRHSIAVCTKNPRTLRVFEAADKPQSSVPLGIQQYFWDRVGAADSGKESVLPLGIGPEALRRQSAGPLV